MAYPNMSEYSSTSKNAREGKGDAFRTKRGRLTIAGISHKQIRRLVVISNHARQRFRKRIKLESSNPKKLSDKQLNRTMLRMIWESSPADDKLLHHLKVTICSVRDIAVSNDNTLFIMTKLDDKFIVKTCLRVPNRFRN